MKGQIRFWNLLAKFYSKQKISDMNSYEIKLEKTRALFTPESNVFEFGCGTGSTAILHAPYVKHIYATDFSPKMIEIAQRKIDEGTIENITFEVKDFNDLQVEDETIDVCMAMSVLHLMPKYRGAIADVHKMLKKGGVFVSSTTLVSEEGPLMRGVLRFLRGLGIIPTVQFFTIDDLQQAMLDAGFVIEEVWKPGPKKAVYIAARK